MSNPARKPTINLVLPRFLALVALASAIVLGVAPAAQATTDLVPNPGFESDCSGVPCNWVATSVAVTLTRDTSTHHSGSASMKVTQSAAALNTSGAGSSCVNTAIAAGNHDASFWYLTSDLSAEAVEFVPVVYAGANCTGSSTLAGKGTQTTVDGAWHQFSFTANTPAGSSVLFVLNVEKATSSTPTVYFDDVDFESEATAVTLSSLKAARTLRGVVVHWRTGTEADLLGFQVYRSRGQSWQRISHSLIAAKGSVSGAPYRFLDRTAKRSASYRYRIKAVNRDGTASWFGPVRVM
jgi:hypothetical protein